MTEFNALDGLTHYAETPLSPNPEFAAALIESLLDDLDRDPAGDRTGVAAFDSASDCEVLDLVTPSNGFDVSGRSTKAPIRMNRGRVIFAAAAVAFIVVLAIGAGQIRGSDQAPTRPTTEGDSVGEPDSATKAAESLDVARQFMESSNQWDGPSLRNLFVDDAAINDLATTPDELLAQAEFNRAIREQFLEVECAVKSPEVPSEIRCDYLLQNAWGEALGVGPFDGSFVDFCSSLRRR